MIATNTIASVAEAGESPISRASSPANGRVTTAPTIDACATTAVADWRTSIGRCSTISAACARAAPRIRIAPTSRCRPPLSPSAISAAPAKPVNSPATSQPPIRSPSVTAASAAVSSGLVSASMLAVPASTVASPATSRPM